MYLTQKKFLEVLTEKESSVVITKHKNGEYSVSIETQFGMSYALEHSRQRDYPRLFKTVAPVFSLLESVGIGGFDITFIIQNQDK